MLVDLEFRLNSRYREENTKFSVFSCRLIGGDTLLGKDIYS